VVNGLMAPYVTKLSAEAQCSDTGGKLLKWDRRLMLAGVGSLAALALLVAAVMMFNATELPGVPRPDGAPSVGPGDEVPLQSLD
ncbi:MAG: hypothetical protein ACTS5I_15540, partial [Rhodanobacter sp.]